MEVNSMIEVYPHFFPQFFCKADKCTHTCCQKWEIDIDSETKALYDRTEGPLGKELAEWTRVSEEGFPCFRLNEEGYCHFLNEKGLCRLILEKGEDYLCQICRDHPRFYKFTYDTCAEEEIRLAGTGLSCEKTVEQLMEVKGPLFFHISIMQEEVPLKTITDRLLLGFSEEDLTFHPDFSEGNIAALLAHLKATNPIDKEWEKELAYITDHQKELAKAAEENLKDIPKNFLSNLFQYILYRELDECGAYDPLSILRYASESLHFILLLFAWKKDLLRATTRWSEQIEYDNENVYILLDEIEDVSDEL